MVLPVHGVLARSKENFNALQDYLHGKEDREPEVSEENLSDSSATELNKRLRDLNSEFIALSASISKSFVAPPIYFGEVTSKLGEAMEQMRWDSDDLTRSRRQKGQRTKPMLTCFREGVVRHFPALFKNRTQNPE